ncbi:MAG: hypothetical protein ACK2TT_02040 [Anaerolineales bacterium]|jgi:hypothetical protein
MVNLTLPLSLATVKELISRAEESFRHDECAACECYLGYVTQLEIDSDPEGRAFLENYQPPRDQQHSCLGCDPCPAGILYADYLRKKKLPLKD